MKIETIVKLSIVGVSNCKNFTNTTARSLRGVIVDQPDESSVDYQAPIDGFVWVAWDHKNGIQQIDMTNIETA